MAFHPASISVVAGVGFEPTTFGLLSGEFVARCHPEALRDTSENLDAYPFPLWAALDLVGCRSRREVGESLTLLDSSPACEEGLLIDSARLPHALYPLAPNSQTACCSRG